MSTPRDTRGRLCPVCGADFDLDPQRTRGGTTRPPSLVLEVGASLDERPPRPWRLSVPGTDLVRTSTARPFTRAEWTYALCGNGHYFLTAVAEQALRQQARLSFGDQSFTAAIGPVASGKSYLLVRTLNQPLIPAGEEYHRAKPPPDVGRNDPLESVPKHELEDHYRRTLGSKHLPIPATRRQELVPSRILLERVSDEIFDAAVALQEEFMGSGRDALDPWGTTVRQPIFLRRRVADRTVLTCVADLAGELFDVEDQQQFRGARDLRTMLAWCNALIWVIDPLHGQEQNFQDFLADSVDDPDLVHKAVSGSSRPDELRVTRDVEEDIENRSSVYGRIAEELARSEGDLARNLGGTLRNLVVISKCDLLELALQKNDLDALGDPGSVRRGTAIYLSHLARRMRDRGPTRFSTDVATLLTYLGTPRQEAQEERCDQVADAIVGYYSDNRAFWNLVHHGGLMDQRGRLQPETVALDASGSYVLEQRTITVPTADQHLLASLQPGGADRLQMRDVVMSALGCGIMFGLGHADEVIPVLLHDWQAQEFFLCSPLGTVPLAEDAAQERITPIGRSRYPKVHGRSAGLQQLLLRILKEALP